MNRTVIIGGGITGLSATWTLCQASTSDEIILLEQSKRLGGSIYTEHLNGFLMEHGPDVFVANKPEAVQLCESLGLPLQKTSESQRGVYLRCGSSMHVVPSGLVPQRIWPLLNSPLLSIRGKLRVLAELMLPVRKDVADESVADFFMRRFGREAFTTLMKPLIGGFAGDDVEHLSMQALLPHVQSLESKYGSLLLSANRIPSDKLEASFRSLPTGLSSLVDALHRSTKESIQLGSQVTEIQRTDTCWNVSIAGRSGLSATHLILAVPAWVAAKLTGSLNAELGDLLRSIPYRAGTMVHLAYRQTDVKRSLRGHGHLVSPDGHDVISACTWSANKLIGRSPTEHQLFRLYLRGVDLSDSAVIMLAKAEMKKALHITASPLLTRLYRYSAALPQYRLGHRDQIRKIQRIIKSLEGLYLAGNFIDGVGIPDCIRNGTQAANQILQQ